mmetsp:Transcript_17313/g.46968  ORF Transcript_17313/g.46968 Transcript_17313/m.46968 type:complete len:380 (-) Transcript_17313:48-1187(-)
MQPSASDPWPNDISETKGATLLCLGKVPEKSAACVTGRPRVVPQWLVHVALLVGQSVNGGASVVAKCGLPATNPVLFALIRESGASPVLFLLAFATDGRRGVACKELPYLVLAAASLYLAQVGWVTGIKLANPVVGSAWQPSQPIMVLLIAVFLRWESCTIGKTAGILSALFGGLLLTFGGDSALSGGTHVLGNALFFYNCLGSALFIISMRVITRTMPAMTAVAYVYSMTTVGILVTALVVSTSHDMQHFVCPDCTHTFWYFPSGAVFALLYWIFGCSVFAYAVLGFGTKHAKDATHCLAYTALQPVVAVFLEACLVLGGWNDRHPENALVFPSLVQTLGALAVVVGIIFVIFDALQPDRLHEVRDDGYTGIGKGIVT